MTVSVAVLDWPYCIDTSEIARTGADLPQQVTVKVSEPGFTWSLPA